MLRTVRLCEIPALGRATVIQCTSRVSTFNSKSFKIRFAFPCFPFPFAHRSLRAGRRLGAECQRSDAEPRDPDLSTLYRTETLNWQLAIGDASLGCPSVLAALDSKVGVGHRLPVEPLDAAVDRGLDLIPPRPKSASIRTTATSMNECLRCAYLPTCAIDIRRVHRHTLDTRSADPHVRTAPCQGSHADHSAMAA